MTAPELGLEKILQAPAGARADWESLRGKVIVLEAIRKEFGLEITLARRPIEFFIVEK